MLIIINIQNKSMQRQNKHKKNVFASLLTNTKVLYKIYKKYKILSYFIILNIYQKYL
jgi:hypothetical protein